MNITASLSEAGVAANASETDGSLAALEALIAEQIVRYAEDNVLWERTSEISDEISNRLPWVRVQTGRMLRGRDDDGKEIYDPIYAYTDEKIDKDIEPHYQALLAMRGNREDLCSPVHEYFKARKEKLKADLAALETERKKIEDDAGYTAAIEAARASADAMRELEAKIINFRSSSLAAAARQAQWVLWAQDENSANSYLEDEDVAKALGAIAKACS